MFEMDIRVSLDVLSVPLSVFYTTNPTCTDLESKLTLPDETPATFLLNSIIIFYELGKRVRSREKVLSNSSVFRVVTRRKVVWSLFHSDLSTYCDLALPLTQFNFLFSEISKSSHCLAFT